MKARNDFDQHIAVFGESGSGKTVLLSSFFGAAQEPQFRTESLYHIETKSFADRTRLHGNYLDMKNEAQTPEATSHAPTSYTFDIEVKNGDSKAAKGKQLRLIWHDYPGEWFEDDVSSPEEELRRIRTFRSLLASDVALILVDGQRLLDNASEEDRYLRLLFSNLRSGLHSLKDDLLPEGKPLARFPRIWMVALSKADLLPDMDVYAFRDLVVRKARNDLSALRDEIAGLIEGNQALSVGEEFILLSSAKFEPEGMIKVSERVGVDLILPIAAVLPFERYAKWAREKHLSARAMADWLDHAGPFAAALLGKARFFADKLPAPLGVVVKAIAAGLTREVLDEAAKLAAEGLRKRHDEALAKKDNMAAMLMGFKMDLEKSVEDRVLLRNL